MALRRFIPWPGGQLCQKAEPIGAITQNACALRVGMIEKMEGMWSFGLEPFKLCEMFRLVLVNISLIREKQFKWHIVRFY